jgi:retron-type reverse transcriptase
VNETRAEEDLSKMANRQSTNRFGIDQVILKTIDWELASRRVLVDVRSDFIYAPHLSNVFRHASAELMDEVKSELSSGRFAPAPPITIEVPKSSRMQVVPRGSRGPTFSRPGGILLPKDRLLYQALADQAAPLIEKNTDRNRSYSHRFLRKSDEMFESSRSSWSRMQSRLNQLSSSKKGYVIKADVANCFASVNQHTLVNHLESIGYPASLKNALDTVLVLNTGDRNSRGLLQGIFPSDLLGNFYMNPVDQALKDLRVRSVRYVDDIYIFVSTVSQAEQIARKLTKTLRDYDLILNESKSKLINSKSLLIEEPDLEKLFSDASDELKGENIDSDYGFQSEWDDSDNDDGDEEETSDLQLSATIVLFNSIDEFPSHVEKIERFCLPLFAAARSNYAVDHVLATFPTRPAMAQIYCSYLSNFLDAKEVRFALQTLFTNAELYYDWQRMWILASLMTPDHSEDEIVAWALKTYKDGQRHEALRAVAAIFTAKHGAFARKKELADEYNISGSIYLQTAVLYGARYFQSAQRRAVLKSWSSQTGTHSLVAKSIEGLAK